MLTETPGVAAIDEGSGKSGLVKLAATMRDNVQVHDDYITSDLRRLAKPDSVLMKLPDHLSDQFARWDAADVPPERRKLYEMLKTKLTAMHEQQAQTVSDKIASTESKMHLEFAIQTVSKTTRGLQTLLTQG